MNTVSILKVTRIIMLKTLAELEIHIILAQWIRISEILALDRVSYLNLVILHVGCHVWVRCQFTLLVLKLKHMVIKQSNIIVFIGPDKDIL